MVAFLSIVGIAIIVMVNENDLIQDGERVLFFSGWNFHNNNDSFSRLASNIIL